MLNDLLVVVGEFMRDASFIFTMSLGIIVVVSAILFGAAWTVTTLWGRYSGFFKFRRAFFEYMMGKDEFETWRKWRDSDEYTAFIEWKHRDN